MPAKIDLLESLGAEVIVPCRIKADRVALEGATAEGEEPSLPLAIGTEPVRRTPFWVARVDPRVQPRAGDTVALVADTDHLQFFDIESGAAITT
ncbi:MAG: hypothetical protein ACREN1_06915 [Candidatus Dormibacteria bacterium]